MSDHVLFVCPECREADEHTSSCPRHRRIKVEVCIRFYNGWFHWSVWHRQRLLTEGFEATNDGAQRRAALEAEIREGWI